MSCVMSGDSEIVIKTIKEIEYEDIRLQNWAKWQKEWQWVQRQIAAKLNTETGNLVENFSEGVRNINEQRQVLDYAKIPTEFDKYRGKPDFYCLPNALTKRQTCFCFKTVVDTCKCCGQKCCCRIRTHKSCTLEPTYFAVKSMTESYVIPPIELIGIPEAIRREKNILNGTRNIYKKWQNSKYRQQQMDLLAESIKNIVPHWPDFEQLIVIGSKVVPESIEDESYKSEKSEQEKISKDTESKTNETRKEMSSNEAERPYIAVNGIRCYDGERRKVRLFFEYDISSDDTIVNFLHLVNTGSRTMRVSWKKVEKFFLFRDITQEHWEKFGFYFDRKELVILPFKKISLPIWFKTKTPGAHSESWELITRPRSNNEGCIILLLESYSYFKDMKEKIEQMVKYINVKTKMILIKDILFDVVQNVKYQQHDVEVCVFEEAQIFEISNLINGYPQFLYKEEFVKELNDIYNHLKTNNRLWDFSVKNLIRLAHRKDTVLYLENKSAQLMEKIAKIETRAINVTNEKEKSPSKKKNKKDKKKSKSSKSSKKGSSKGKKSKSTKTSKSKKDDTEVEEKKEPIEQEQYEFSNQLQVWNVVKKLDSPVLINSEREKYFACTEVVTFYFNKMCHMLESLEIEKTVRKETVYPSIKNQLIPINDLPERLIYERFDNNYVHVPLSDEPFTVGSKRKPKILRNIPSDDIETLYTTYFNKSLTDKGEPKIDKKKKKKGKNKSANKKTKSASDKVSKKSKTSKKNKKKKTPQKQKIEPLEMSIESFKPYAELFLYTPETEKVDETIISKPKQLTGKDAEDYHYEQYLIVYSCLSNAVDALVDTIHSFECVVSHSTLKEVKDQLSEDQET